MKIDFLYYMILFNIIIHVLLNIIIHELEQKVV